MFFLTENIKVKRHAAGHKKRLKTIPKSEHKNACKLGRQMAQADKSMQRKIDKPCGQFYGT